MYTNAAKHSMLDHLAGILTHVGLHKATTLSTEATLGATQIVTVAEITVGAEVRVDVSGADEEIVWAGAVSGAGPYTVDLVDAVGDPYTLTATHEVGTLVGFDPDQDGSNLLPPTDGSPAYTRQAITFAAAGTETAGSLDATSSPQFDVPASTITHVTGHTASTGGTFLVFGWLSSSVTFTGQAVFTLDDLDIDLNS